MGGEYDFIDQPPNWMSLDSSQLALRQYATPAVQQVNINPTNLQKIIFACPIDLAEQKLIVERLYSIDDKLEVEKDKLKKMKYQKAGLMHDLLTGKVAVTVNDGDTNGSQE